MAGWSDLRSRRPRPDADPPPELRLLVERGDRYAFHAVPRLVAPKKPRRSPRRSPRRNPVRILVRAGLGSLGVALVAGISCGRALVPSPAAPPEVRIHGAGHLGAWPAGALLGSAGLVTDAATIRDRFRATGLSEEVVVERALFGSLPGNPGANLRIEVTEKRAVALLAGNPPEALSGDGTVLGPASVRDFDWADAPDLLLVRGVRRDAADFAARAALAGRLAAALRTRPELDRLVSELRVDAGPLRIGVVLRSPGITVLLTEDGFLERFELVAGLLPDLVGRWPRLARIDARVPDRLLLRSHRLPGAAAPGLPEGGRTP